MTAIYLNRELYIKEIAVDRLGVQYYLYRSYQQDETNQPEDSREDKIIAKIEPTVDNFFQRIQTGGENVRRKKSEPGDL